jgi:hypothetical protein
MSRGAMPVTGIALALVAGPASAQDAAVPQRPAYNFQRFREDWSVLREIPEEERTDFWDPIKYIPLSRDGVIWASFGGSARLRLENWSNFNFVPGADDTFLLWRLLMHVDVHLGENIRAFVQGKSSLSTKRDLPGGTRTLDVDELDLEEAFADFRIPFGSDLSLTLRPGRQWLLFGRQRVVSPLTWSNTLRRWDGASAILECGGWTAQGFWGEFVPVLKYDFNVPDRQTQLYGVYATGPVLGSDLSMDFYMLGLDKGTNVTFDGTTGPERRYTLGGRAFGKVGATGLDYDVEGAWQWGDVGAGDVNAAMFGGIVGYRAEGLWGQPRFTAGFDWGSGDRTAGGDVETYNQLFPLGHAFLGYIDVIGRQNIASFNLGASVQPLKNFTVSLTGYQFWRADSADALYDAGGAVVRPGAPGASLNVGQEIDLVLSYQFDRHLLGELGYSHFFAGDFIDESGPGDDIDFLYVQLEYTF